MKVPCTACRGVPWPDRRHCHECRGVGYTEHSEVCNWFNHREDLAKCPVEYEPMVEGWICDRCGRSGPL